VVRWNRPDGTKKILPISLRADGWRVKAMPTPRVLYGLPELLEADPAAPVCVCEGEQCADMASKLGFTATTSSGGADAASKTDWTPLSGREVWIFPDNDPAGRKYAADVVSILTRLPTPPKEIRIVELPGLPDAGDIVDWVASHGDSAEPEALRQEIESLAQEAELWQPDDLNAPNGTDGSSDGVKDLEYRPFPVQALPEPLRTFVSVGSQSIGCDPSYLALPLLSVISAAVGNTRRLSLKDSWLVCPVIWASLVGESGAGKTPALQLVLRPVYERQRKALERHAAEEKRYRATLACWEKDMAAWKRKGVGLPPVEPEAPKVARLVVSDTTVEALAPILLDNPRGVLLARDELSAWISSFDRYANKGRASTDSTFWLSAFSAASVVVDRKTGPQRTIYVPQAAAAITGGIQPAILKRVLSPEHRESGLAARLLLAYPPRRAKQWTEAGVDPAAEAEWARLLDRLYELQPAIGPSGEPQPAVVRLGADAKRLWIDYYNKHNLEQIDLVGDLSMAWSKFEEYVPRLAMVLHFARWASGDVTDELRLDAASMSAAIELTQWFKSEAKRVYTMLDESDAEREQRRLIEWIANRGGRTSVREVQTYYWKLKSPGQAEAELEKLAQAGVGCWQDVPTTPKGGRPARAFVLTTFHAPAKPSQGKPSAKPSGIQEFLRATGQNHWRHAG
jgi:hypothetical protein